MTMVRIFTPQKWANATTRALSPPQRWFTTIPWNFTIDVTQGKYGTKNTSKQGRKEGRKTKGKGRGKQREREREKVRRDICQMT